MVNDYKRHSNYKFCSRVKTLGYMCAASTFTFDFRICEIWLVGL